MADPYDISLGLRVNDMPCTSRGATSALDLTTSDATLALTTGAYQAWNAGTVNVMLRLGGVASFPSTGNTLASAFPVPAGGVASFTVDPGGETLHGVTASGAATVYITRVSQ